MTSSKIIFYLCLCFILGVFIGSIFNFSNLVLLVFLILSVFFVSFFWQRKKLIFFGFCLFFLILGVFREDFAEKKIENNSFKSFYREEVSFTGIVCKEPENREKIIRLVVCGVLLEGKKQEGKVLITAGRYPEYNYGDLLKIEGKIEEPQNLGDFNYKDYLLKDGIFAVLSFPKIQLLKKESLGDPFSQFYSKVLALKGKLRESIQKSFSPPYSSVLEGMILGDNFSLSNELKEKLNITGLRHIIAISGSHIVILGNIIMFFLLLLGFWRNQAFYLSLAFIILYISLTGFPASGIRAGVMGTIFLLAQKLGRQNKIQRAVGFACFLMLAFNPLLLLKDAGFQLSFLASLGIIYLNPLLISKMKFFPEKFSEIKNIISMTLSAQIFTMPIMVFNFGNISLVALITNILVLPFVSLLMIFGFFAAFLGAFSFYLGWIFFLPCWFLLFYFLKIIDIFSKEWMIVRIDNLSFVWLFIFYFILFFLVYYLRKKEKLKFLNY